MGADNEAVGFLKKLLQVFLRYARAEIDRQACFLSYSENVCAFRGITGDAAGYDHRIAAHELDGVSGFTDPQVRCDGVGAVFLLYVGPDLDTVRANHATVAEQLGGG